MPKKLTEIEINKIREISQQGVIYPHQINEIWEMYFNIKEIYPMGSKTCDSCIRDTFQTVKNAMVTQLNEPPAAPAPAPVETDKLKQAKINAENYINGKQERK